MSRYLLGRIATVTCLVLVSLAWPIAGWEVRPQPQGRVDIYGSLAAAPLIPAALTPDPLVTQMLAQVTQSWVYDYAADLSGERPVTIDGSPHTLATRSTLQALPIHLATQYALERLQGMGLQAGYHNWTADGLSGRNVVAEKPGTVRAAEIVLLTAHLDDRPNATVAPGADDNASGSAGVLVAADILSHYQFERTLRFVLFTGEEQGLVGSNAYAGLVAGQNIVAVYNMDAIAWDAVGGPALELHTRMPASPGYAEDLQIANLFVDVVTAYGLAASLTPTIVSDGQNASAQASFWPRGIPAILATEDLSHDFNPYFQMANDKLSNLNPAYFTSFVKAAVGTAAHLAHRVEPVYGLQVTPAEAVQSGDPGATVQYILQVHNIGNVADSFAVSLGSRAWATAAPSQLGPLAPGAGSTLNVSVVIPPAALDGEEDMAVVQVASQGEPARSRTATLTTRAQRLHGVSLAPLEVHRQAFPGHTVTYSLWITNTGSLADTFTVATGDHVWPLGPVVSSIALAPRAGATFDVAVFIPAKPAQASDSVTLTVTSAGDPAQAAAARLTTAWVRLRAWLPIMRR